MNHKSSSQVASVQKTPINMREAPPDENTSPSPVDQTIVVNGLLLGVSVILQLQREVLFTVLFKIELYIHSHPYTRNYR